MSPPSAPTASRPVNPIEIVAALVAEVKALREEVADLKADRPDYDSSFQAVIAAVKQNTASIAEMQQNETFSLAPLAHVRNGAAAALAVLGPTAKSLETAAHSFQRSHETKYGTAAHQNQMVWVGGLALAAGFILYPLAAAFGPGGTTLAAIAAGYSSPSEAGRHLMAVSDPDGFHAMMANATAFEAVKVSAAALTVELATVKASEARLKDRLTPARMPSPFPDDDNQAITDYSRAFGIGVNPPPPPKAASKASRR